MFFTTVCRVALLFSTTPESACAAVQLDTIHSKQDTIDIRSKQQFQAISRDFGISSNSQDAVKDPDLQKVLERLQQFNQEEQKAMVESILLTMLDQQHDQFYALQKLAEQIAKKKLKTLRKIESRHYESAEFAPALRLRTRIVKATSSRWKRHAKKYRNYLDPVSSIETWQWSYGQHHFHAPAKELSPSEIIRKIWQGEWPEPDRIAAEIAALLDNDPKQKAVADYFEHSYRDRDGYVYTGFTLEQMWSSGATFGISDVETIAFLRLILEDDSMQSPINKRLHKGLYALIKDAFLEFREYKQLRQALSVRFANPHGKVPAILASTSDRFDIAWALCDYQVEKMRHFLSNNPTRKKFFAAVTAWEKEPGVPAEELQARLAQHQAFPAAVIRAAQEAIRREGLMGLRGR